MNTEREDEYHVYVRHDEVTYFLAEDGTFVPDLDRGRVFYELEEVFDIINRMTEGRDLPFESEPGMVRNARRWLTPGD
ncbi:hypothetical protein H0176_10785 [Methylorubrum populi]|jgi:hypothetical protein|uniref:Uncharacterized protein n=1 Tax=Methylorubrum rhodesianum TaxID=29427 RepID=A0ABU9ZC57_9HYPH|nr:hypothetical protein [Methylorubrum rhodesianum]MBK3403821.1 hypothetical protein [Methylorubrum rhodesianum]MBY0140759.1 hypothetical protein [Methylorubrum populi]